VYIRGIQQLFAFSQQLGVRGSSHVACRTLLVRQPAHRLMTRPCSCVRCQRRCENGVNRAV